LNVGSPRLILGSTPARKEVNDTSPTRQRGAADIPLAGASGWSELPPGEVIGFGPSPGLSWTPDERGDP